MSCNGCRVLRKGCSESCVLRPCLQWIDTAEAQGHATVFVAKFFGRAGLMSFVSAVPDHRRSALFQSLLYEACGRTINPVNGAVGLLSTGNWHLCVAAVDAVLRGGAPRRLTDLGAVAGDFDPERPSKRRRSDPDRHTEEGAPACDLDLCLSPMTSEGGNVEAPCRRRRPSTPSMNSEGSVTTSGERATAEGQPRVLNLFV